MSDSERNEAPIPKTSGLTDKELKKIQEFKEQEDRKGVIYISRVPPFMKPEKVKHLMSEFGEVGRVYLQPEDENEWRRRRKAGGNRARKYIDGWVEFMDKKLARRVAESLNNTPVGGKKRHNFWRDDIWNMRYLPKFKWNHLTEYAFYKKSVREEKIRAIMTSQRKEQNMLLEQVEVKKRREKMEEKRSAKRAKLSSESNAQGGDDEDDEDDVSDVSDYTDDEEDDLSDDIEDPSESEEDDE